MREGEFSCPSNRQSAMRPEVKNGDFPVFQDVGDFDTLRPLLNGGIRAHA